jgi:hypothetical protein
LLEGGLRIPAIISWPGRVAAGRVSEQVTANMDWLPTLLASAGAMPDASYPLDGMNLPPHLTEGAGVVERRLFWRYKSLWQRAARIGDWKYLKILDNTFCSTSSMIRWSAPIERRKDTYDRLIGEWNAWNATMLAETATSFAKTFTGAEMADRIGRKPVTLDPDPELR